MMGMYALAILVSVLLVCTGAHVIDKRQVTYNNLYLCSDNAARIEGNSHIYVKSPNFDSGNYLDNTRCNLVLKSGNETLFVTVRYDSFELEVNNECGFDFLCVGGYKFCGNWAATHEYSFIIPANRNFTLDFKTDGSVTARGFQTTVKVWTPSVPCNIAVIGDRPITWEVFISTTRYVGQTALSPVGGVGSSNNSLLLDYVRYSSNYSNTYQDKCSVDNNGGNWNYQTSPYYYTTNPWYYQTSPNYYTTNQWNYQTTPYYYTTSQWNYQTTPYYFTTNQWNYQTTPYYYTTNQWNYQTSPNYYTTNPWYYQTSSNYYTDYPWYYQTSPDYTTDYPYYYNTSPGRRQDTTFLRYFLYEALSALGEANYNSEAAIQSLQRAIAYLEGNAGGKK